MSGERRERRLLAGDAVGLRRRCRLSKQPRIGGGPMGVSQFRRRRRSLGGQGAGLVQVQGGLAADDGGSSQQQGQNVS